MELKTKDFEEKVIKNKKPVLVDFWGSWCIPCKQMEPIIDRLAKSQQNLEIHRINVNQNPAIASRHHIMGVPTFILFEKGRELGRMVGSQTVDQLEKFLKDNLT